MLSTASRFFLSLFWQTSFCPNWLGVAAFGSIVLSLNGCSDPTGKFPVASGDDFLRWLTPLRERAEWAVLSAETPKTSVLQPVFSAQAPWELLTGVRFQSKSMAPAAGVPILRLEMDGEPIPLRRLDWPEPDWAVFALEEALELPEGTELHLSWPADWAEPDRIEATASMVLIKLADLPGPVLRELLATRDAADQQLLRDYFESTR